MEVNGQGRQKLGQGRKSLQGAKHSSQSDLLQGPLRKSVLDLGTSLKGTGGGGGSRMGCCAEMGTAFLTPDVKNLDSAIIALIRGET